MKPVQLPTKLYLREFEHKRVEGVLKKGGGSKYLVRKQASKLVHVYCPRGQLEPLLEC